MKKILFDSGVEEFLVNGGQVLRFNPADPNVYARFLEAGEKIRHLEETLTQQAQEASDREDTGRLVLELMKQADLRIKELLNWVFGGENDFDRILKGVNLLAVADNGQLVITNLLAALQPILTEGAERCADQRIEDAVRKAEDRRAVQ